MFTALATHIAPRAEDAVEKINGVVSSVPQGFWRGVGQLIATGAIFILPASVLPIVDGRWTLLVVLVSGLGLILHGGAARWIGAGSSLLFLATYIASWDLSVYPTWLHAVGFLGSGLALWRSP